MTVFRAAERPLAPAVAPGNYDRVARSIRGHSMLGYYCSPFPYRGPFSRLRMHLKDRRAAAQGTTPREVIDTLIAAESSEQDRSTARS